MAIKSTIRASYDVLKRYGVKTFVAQSKLKMFGHNFERADEFLIRRQKVETPEFEPVNEMQKGLVSIVVPCYNHEEFVEKALTSVYNQTYKDIELIVIDDCSKDDSPNIIENLFAKWEQEKRFKSLKFIKHEQNKGAHYSINQGVNLTSGEYVAILNSDDYYDKDRFELLVDMMKEECAGVSFAHVLVIDEHDVIKTNTPFSIIQSDISNDHMFYGVCRDNLAISSGNLLFKRDVLEKIGLFRDFQYVHDWDFLLRAICVTKVVFCDKTNYYYRMHSTNSFLQLKGNTDLCDSEMTEVRSRVFAYVYEKEQSNLYSEEDYYRIIDLLYRRLVNSTYNKAELISNKE